MSKLHAMLIRGVIPILFLALIFFCLSLELLELFQNLANYLTLNVPPNQIMQVAALYLPKTVSFALPLAILFSVSYTMGSLYSHNELISVFGSGVSLTAFTRPLLVLGLLLSALSFIFEETVVLPTYKAKNELSRNLLHQEVTTSNSNVSVLSAKGRVIYSISFFNDQNSTLSSVLIIIKDPQGRIHKRVDAEWADWKETRWILNKARVFTWDPKELEAVETYEEAYDDPILSEPPETFRRKTARIEELGFREAFTFVESLKSAGLPYKDAETDFYQRFAFSLIPFVVILLSGAIGGRFKKNILLLSLINSLMLAVGYYVTQMITSLLAKMGYLPTIVGASAAFFIALAAGIILFIKART